MDNQNPNPQTPQGGGNPHVKTTEDFIAECRVSLINTALADIDALLKPRGYDQALIKTKLDELNVLETLNETQKQEYGEQYAATENYVNAENNLHEDYADHIELARVAFKNDIAAQTALDVNGRRKKSQSGYAAQAKLFYNGVLNNTNYKAAMNAKGVTDAEMKVQLDIIDNFSTLKAAQKKETGEAQAATANRDKALHTFEDWFTDFKDVAQVALRKFPQLKEKLGWKD